MFNLESFLTSGAIVSLDSEHIVVGWGERRWVERAVNYPSWYFPSFFFEEAKPYFEHAHTCQMKRGELLGQLARFPEEKRKEWSEPKWELFVQAFERLKSMIKVVPYVQKRAEGEANIATLLRAALQYHSSHAGTFLYGFWGGDEGMLGVTPELLVRCEARRFSTMAVAGTVPVGQIQEMLHDVKLMHEHQIVVESICQDLAPFGKLERGTTAAEAFSRIAHLVTPISMQADVRPEAIVQALHPTPALGAFPKQEGMSWLKAYAQKIPRIRYGAPAGVFLSPSNGVCYVAIRNMQWKGNQLTLTAGCGIVAGSNIEKEKQEILTKFSAIQEILKV